MILSIVNTATCQDGRKTIFPLSGKWPTRTNGQTGRLSSERLVSIPRELAPHDRLELVREFVQDAIGERHPYAFAMHNSRACDGGKQPHAPMMFSTRTVDGIARGPADFFPRANTTQPALGGAAKDTTWYAKSTLHDLRRDWADIAHRS